MGGFEGIVLRTASVSIKGPSGRERIVPSSFHSGTLSLTRIGLNYAIHVAIYVC